MTNTKITNKIALNYVLDTYNDIPDEIREKLEKMLEQVEKKSGVDKKPTAKQAENGILQAYIITNMADNRWYTISEMIKEFPDLNDLSNQKVSALMRPMVDVSVEKSKEKGKTYFKKINK